MARRQVETLYIDPGCPWQNGKEERFNGTVRDECLNLQLFTSPQMWAAQARFADWIAHFSFSEPILPVIGNADARPYQRGQIKQQLVQQITERVRWRESIRYLMEQGETLFEERADSRILRPLIEQIQAERTAMGH